MSLIPFILELADELHEFNRCLATGGMDVDDFGFGIYPHELQPQQQQTQTQHPLQQQQPQQQHLSQQRRPRPLSQFYWMPNISKSRHHPYYRGKPCCNKMPIQLVHEHHLEKESSSTAGGGGGVSGTNSTGGTSAGDKESAANAHSPNSGTHNVPSTTAAGKSAYSVVNKNGFQVSMNVKQFAPNELTVKTIDNCIVVEGQHEDKEDGHGVISRHFIRKYMLPKGYDPNDVLSTLSSDGILTVKAPPPTMKTDETLERIVDIQQTGGSVQVQTKELHTISSEKEDQANVAAPGVEQAATSVAAVAGTLPIPAIITLQQQQKQQQQQQPQQMTATVEGVQQQQPAKAAQPTIKDLQVTRERNGNIESNEMVAEQETEPRTAESAATSSNANNISNNNSINNNSEVSSINRSCAKPSAATSMTNLKTDIKEKESLAEDDTKTVGSDNVPNKKMALTSTVATTSAIDAIMTAVTADEPMETEAEEEIIKDVGKKMGEDSLLTSDIEDTLPIVSDINSVANSSSSSNNNSASDNFVTNNNSLDIVETNGIEVNSANDAVIELAGSAIVEASDIVVVTNNGVPEIKTAEGLTISVETATAATEIDEATELEAEVCEATDGVDADMDADGLDGGGPMSIAADIGVGIDVNVIGADENRANVEDGNDESSSVGNLVVAAQSPSAADLVAAADAAILLSKTQCDVSSGAGDVAAGKPAITTEEITN